METGYLPYMPVGKPITTRRHPRFGNMKAMAKAYTNNEYQLIRLVRERARDGVAWPVTKGTTRTEWALVELMRDAKLRAPHKPLGCDNVTMLFRGINLPRDLYQRQVQKGYLDDPSFASFSVSHETAQGCSEHDDGCLSHILHGLNRRGVVLVLPVADVPAGTPWLWFGHACGRKRTASNKNRLRARFEHEQEVLLPPGRYRILETEGSDTWYVAFEPDTAATSIAYSSTDPMRRTRRIYPRSYRPAAPANKNAVNGYVPLHALFEGDNRSRTPKRPRNG